MYTVKVTTNTGKMVLEGKINVKFMEGDEIVTQANYTPSEASTMYWEILDYTSAGALPIWYRILTQA